MGSVSPKTASLVGKTGEEMYSGMEESKASKSRKSESNYGEDLEEEEEEEEGEDDEDCIIKQEDLIVSCSDQNINHFLC